MGQSPDEIRQEIDQKRNDAAEKIDQLQSQVQGTTTQMREQVQGTAEQVQETVQQVRQQVQGTVQDTVDTVKHSVEHFDLQQQVRQRPLVAVGAAFVGGIVLGKLTGGGHDDRGRHYGDGSSEYGRHQQYDASGAQRFSSSSSSGGMAEGLRHAIQKSGIDDTIANAAAAMMGSMVDQLRSALDQAFPGFTGKLQSAQKSEGSVVDKAKAAADPASGTDSPQQRMV
jgi:ElaB/YqjD/DUF883 family membrane-anchored ribosome-binding protein